MSVKKTCVNKEFVLQFCVTLVVKNANLQCNSSGPIFNLKQFILCVLNSVKSGRNIHI